MGIEERTRTIRLYDIYGELLTDKQREIVRLYVLENLSYQEIAQLEGVSRQAVKYSLDSSIKALNDLEIRLKVYAKKLALEKELNNLLNELDEKNKLKIQKILDKIW